MANFPEYTNRSVVETIGVVRPRVRGEGLFAAATALSQASTTFGALAKEQQVEKDKQAVADAADEGANAAVRDASGNLAVVPRDNSTAANRAFNKALETRYTSELENDARAHAVDLRAKYQGDPAAFQNEWNAYSEGVTSQAPPAFSGSATIALGRLGAQHYGDLLLKTTNEARALSAQAWGEDLDASHEDMKALAWAGRSGSQEYQKALGAYDGKLKAGVEARFLTPEMADLRRRDIADEGEGIAFARHAYDRYISVGGGVAGVKAARDEMRKNLDDPGLHIPEARRARIEAMVDQKISQEEGLRSRTREEVRADAGETLRKLDLGYPVDPGALSMLADRARAANDPLFADRLKRHAEMQGELSASAALPLPLLAQKAAEADAQASKPETGAFAAERAVALRRLAAGKAQALEHDALTYGARVHKDQVGTLAPIDWNDTGRDPVAETGGLRATLQGRAKQAATVEALEGVPTLPLTDTELDGLKRVVPAMTADQKTALASALSDGLGPRLGAVLGKIAPSKETAAFAWAAGLASKDPATARLVFKGEDVMRANKDAAPTEDATLRDRIDRGLGDAFQALPQARASAVAAATAIYAAGSNDKGDFSKNLDTRRFDDALQRATGGIVEFRGNKVVAPRMGMTQRDFDRTMDGLKDADLGTVDTYPRMADGNPLTADMLRRHGRLTSVGDGLYAVTITGLGDGTPFNPKLPNGRPWYLDLRGRM